ncbi:MAG: protein BatD [Candidatus Eisenbacteria sp.]|nr:protein BatD [Candidatus Eisenbacteria bacterium]
MRKTGKTRWLGIVSGWAVILGLAASSICVAEEISISASVRQRTVTVGSELVLTVVVKASGLRSVPDPIIPDIENAAVYPAGKSTSISTSLSNGRFTSQNSVTHNYVIVPEQEGKLVIGAISVSHKGRTEQTRPIEVQVVAAGQSYTSTSREEGQPPAPEAAAGKDVFVELVTDKANAYVNEELILTFRFYTRVNLLTQPQYEAPRTTGFWVEPLPKRPSYETVIDGRAYLVLEVKSAIFPTRSGAMTIEPATLRCTVAEPERSSSRDPFDRFRRGFFGLGQRGREITLRTDPVEVEVQPLPADGVPTSFGGAVGQFKLTMDADKTSVKQGDPITLTLKVSGRGNVNTISAPTFPGVPGLRSYDSGSKVNSAGSADGIEGEKIYERVVVAEVSGDFSIGPAQFSYFDPEKGGFLTLMAGPIEISVAPGPLSIGPRPELPDKQEVRVLSRDILHIHTGGSDLRAPGDPLYRSTWFLLIQVVPLVAYLVTLGHRRHSAKLSADVGYARMRGAGGRARKRLSVARKHLNDSDGLGFYSALEKATREFVGDKFNLATVGMTYEQIESSLQSRGIPYVMIQDLSDVLKECDQARFCPSEMDVALRRESLRRAEEVISRLGRCKA